MCKRPACNDYFRLGLRNIGQKAGAEAYSHSQPQRSHSRCRRAENSKDDRLMDFLHVLHFIKAKQLSVDRAHSWKAEHPGGRDFTRTIRVSRQTRARDWLCSAFHAHTRCVSKMGAAINRVYRKSSSEFFLMLVSSVCFRYSCG